MSLCVNPLSAAFVRSTSNVQLRPDRTLDEHADPPRPEYAAICGSTRSANARLVSTLLPYNLHIDRRGQTEVQNLRHDIGRQEIERRAGKLLAADPAQRAHVIRLSADDFQLQCHQNVRIRRADLARIAVREIHLAIRQTDVVQNVVQLTWRNLSANRVFT